MNADNCQFKGHFITLCLQRYFSDSNANSPDKIQEVKGQVDELKGIMVKNIGMVYVRCTLAIFIISESHAGPRGVGTRAFSCLILGSDVLPHGQLRNRQF